MKTVLILLFLTAYSSMFGQSLFEPNYALKRPQTLELINIELKEAETILNISIENRIEGGYFCIDPETYLVTNDGIRLKLLSLSGLPLCPDSYKFKKLGEKKYVTLKFPAINKATEWIDIIEECGENCLSIYGLCLDPSINAELNICFRDIESGRFTEAINKFESLLTRLKGSGNPIIGSTYLNLISLYTDQGSEEKADKLLVELNSLVLPHKSLFLDSLK